MTDGMSLGRQQAGQLACTLTGPPQWGHGIASRIGVDQSFQGSDHWGVMLDQGLPPGSGVADALHGEGSLGEALNGPIDGRAREPSNPGDQGNTASSQALAVEASDEVLLSLIEVRKQQGIFPLKFSGWAHSGIIPTPVGYVTTNFLRTLTTLSLHLGPNSITVDYIPANGFAPSAASVIETIRSHHSRSKLASASKATTPGRVNPAAAIPAGAATVPVAPTVLGPLALEGGRA